MSSDRSSLSATTAAGGGATASDTTSTHSATTAARSAIRKYHAPYYSIRQLSLIRCWFQIDRRTYKITYLAPSKRGTVEDKARYSLNDLRARVPPEVFDQVVQNVGM